MNSTGYFPVSRLFVSGRRRAQFAMGIFVLVGLTTAVAIISDLAQIDLVSRIIDNGSVTMAEVNANDARQSLISSVQLLVRIASIPIFLFWIHRAQSNSRELGGGTFRFTPGWAVGWFFVPVFYIWKPVQVMNEIWRASDPDSGNDGSWTSAPSSRLVLAWWAMYLIANMISRAVSKMMSLDDPTLQQIAAQSLLVGITDALTLVAAILAFFVVWRVDQRQEAKWRRLSGEAGLVGAH